MGWFPFAFLRPTPEQRIRMARELLARDQYNDARLELVGLDHPEAAALRAEALDLLVQVNLYEWRAQKGHPVESQQALDRARSFGATQAQISAFQASRDTETLGFTHRLRRGPPRP